MVVRRSLVSVLRLPTVRFEHHKLKNGLQVLLHRDNRVPLVHVSVYYRIGSSYEEAGFSGFAHLFEHMMFQGSDHLAKNEHGRYIDTAGGSWNATTSKDRTNYYETVPAHYLELALWLEADRMRSLKVTPETFENQRRTVIEEKKQSYDNRPYGSAFLRFDELAYENWAYGHPIIGSVEDLEKASWEDALRFHRTYYGPGRAVLVLSGDIDEKKVLEKVRSYFQEIPKQATPQEPDLREPEQNGEKYESIKDPLAPLPALCIGYHMGNLGSPDYYALSILNVVLSQGESSRLYRRLLYENNWITSFSTGPNEYKGPQLFDCWFQLQDGVDADKVLRVVEEELTKVQEQPISERELEKAKNQVAFSFVHRLSTVASIGEQLASYTVFFDDPHLINQEWERFFSVSTEEILQAAARTFLSRNRTLILVEPTSQQQPTVNQ